MFLPACTCMYICTAHVCHVFSDFTRGRQIPWTWTWRWFWATVWVQLGTKPGSSTRAVSALDLQLSRPEYFCCVYECFPSMCVSACGPCVYGVPVEARERVLEPLGQEWHTVTGHTGAGTQILPNPDPQLKPQAISSCKCFFFFNPFCFGGRVRGRIYMRTF